MQTYVVNLQSKVFDTFRCTKAAQSLDIDIKEKSIHHLKVTADIESEFNIGLIYGASGSGKTTLAKQIFGNDVFKTYLDKSKAVIDQFPPDWSYEQCQEALNGIGLTSVPCWIKPAGNLSNGQQARAEAALAMASNAPIIVIDEWTSVVDRNVAKVMSHCVQKYARKANRKIILLSCHHDVFEWLNPDWMIDVNEQQYIDRRSMVGTFKRSDQLCCYIKEIDKRSWGYFSKYHYLSKRLPGGKNYFFGLFFEDKQIGFGCYNAYLPKMPKIMYSNRVVIHPDYAGLGLGIKFINATAKIMKSRGFTVRASFSSIPLYRARLKDKTNWKLLGVDNKLKISVGSTIGKKYESFRHKVKMFRFQYIGE